MVKKRLIFTLLYSDGFFVLSRNFRLQKVGNFFWLQTNYNFSKISHSIDELVVLDVSRGHRNLDDFCAVLRLLSQGCFAPIAAGGGVRNIEDARKLLRSGADKVVINTSLFEQTGFISDLADEFGHQCIVASIDVKFESNVGYQIWSGDGAYQVQGPANVWIEKISQGPVGDIYLNSIDRDGTGQGYDLELLDLLPINVSKPVILAGGVGNATHLIEGLTDTRVDAVATAHLFNFVGNGLEYARQTLISKGFDLPVWDIKLQNLLKN